MSEVDFVKYFYLGGCGKKFRTYREIFGHAKALHPGKKFDRKTINLIQGARKRGRPRKITQEEINKITKIDHDNLERDFEKEIKRKDKIFYYNLGVLSKAAGDPLTWYSECSPAILQTKSGLYRCISSKLSQSSLAINMKNFSECVVIDDVISEFLIEMSQRVTSKFYKVATGFFDNFRNGVNQYGWDIAFEFKRVHSSNLHTSTEFSTVQHPQILPKIACLFVDKYLSLHLCKFDRNVAIKLIKHFGDWLYEKDYSSMALSLTKDKAIIETRT